MQIYLRVKNIIAITHNGSGYDYVVVGQFCATGCAEILKRKVMRHNGWRNKTGKTIIAFYFLSLNLVILSVLVRMQQLIIAHVSHWFYCFPINGLILFLN